MAYSRLMELASQAEKEGITLGELLARDMASEDMDSMQAELRSEISEGYERIGDFMADVEIPSIEDILTFGPEDILDFLSDDDLELSDTV